LIQLAIPLIVVITIAVAAHPPEMSIVGMQSALESSALTYLAFSASHWIWMSINSYLETSDLSCLGGLVGLNVLLTCIALMVLFSVSYEAANGWLIYFLGTPIAAGLGVVAAKRFGFLVSE
jgi:hypothetical protein